MSCSGQPSCGGARRLQRRECGAAPTAVQPGVAVVTNASVRSLLALAAERQYRWAHTGAADVRLEIGNGQVLSNPTADQVSGVLHALPGADTDSFAILTRDDCHFMQCSGAWKEGFALEYRDGSLDAHFRCSDEELGLAHVIAAFQAYLAGDDRWRTMFQWRKIDVRRR